MNGSDRQRRDEYNSARRHRSLQARFDTLRGESGRCSANYGERVANLHCSELILREVANLARSERWRLDSEFGEPRGRQPVRLP